MNRRCAIRALIAAALVAVCAGTARSQDSAAIEHAKRVLDLLEHDKFGEVAGEFNAQVAAAIPLSRLPGVWQQVHEQVGRFTAFIDERVAPPAGGITAVSVGCQFEKAAVNFSVAFDAENKIGGLGIVPRPAPAEPPPPDSRFTEEPITVGAGTEWALPGTLSMPIGPIAAAVVLVHGSGPGDRDETIGPNKPFRDLAWGLANRGIAVIRYDKRTRRYAGRMAALKNLTVREETIDDAVLAAAALRAHDRIDPKRIFVIGHSLGGTLAPRIAAQDRGLAGLIILAGATRPFDEVVREQLAYLGSLSPGATSVDQGLKAMRGAAPDSYWQDFDAYVPAEAAAKLSLPMLILQGERDYQVTLADLQGWRRALEGHANATIRTYPALNHLFLAGEGKSTPAEYLRAGRIPDAVVDDIAEWIKTR